MTVVAPAPDDARSTVGTTRAWTAPAGVGAAAATATVVLAIGDPNTTHIPLCPLKIVTGLDCPFCGSLRAVHSLAHVDVVGALDHNLIFTVAAPFLVVGWIAWLVRSVRDPHGPSWVAPGAAKAAFWVVVVAYGVARNLPPFAWLASGA